MIFGTMGSMYKATLLIIHLIMIRKIFGTDASLITEQIKKCDDEFRETLFKKGMLVDKRNILEKILDNQNAIFDLNYADKPSNPNDHKQQQNLKNIRKLIAKIEFIDYRIDCLEKELLRLEGKKDKLNLKENLNSFNI
ncbi:hypothetical protein NBO_11g0077 [Nosema bombycis CQ1]|uniref:Uncharacterized protein n=1 Tax=Nosema bombycis (strain CQ1 / CVCC 102059) TaxID=578461 RepID=R0KVT1_NOSB1|nr:hypothetical protein NBO_11g0077 [Nosema bombycis CQ1]|eukprot:EOB15006.1 hypothetical protein NBO_11g0077 [Nosema bombycis CQ1]